MQLDRAVEQVKNLLLSLWTDKPDDNAYVEIVFWSNLNPSIGVRVSEVSFCAGRPLWGSSAMQSERGCAPLLFAVERCILERVVDGGDIDIVDSDLAEAMEEG